MAENVIMVEQRDGSYRKISERELRQTPNVVFEGIDADEEVDRTISWYRRVRLDDPDDLDRAHLIHVGDPGERLLARGKRWAQESGYDDGTDGGSRFTIFCAFSRKGRIEEEIDVDATDTSIARELAEWILAEDYEDGLLVVRIEKRFGLYM